MTRTARRIATLAALAAATVAPAAPAAAFESSWERFHLSNDRPERTYMKVVFGDLIVSSVQGTAAGRLLETRALALAVETDARGNVVAGNFVGADALSAAEQEEAVGLLLPAVQQVREAAARSHSAQSPLFVFSRVAANVDLDGDRVPDATVAGAREGAEGLNGLAFDTDDLAAGGGRAAFSYGG